MTVSACVLRLVVLGFSFQLAPGDVVCAILPGGIPAPPEAAPLLEHLRAHRGELVGELRYRARPRDLVAGKQTRLECPEPPLEEATPSHDARRAEELRAEIAALLEDAEARAAELTEAEADEVNRRYLALCDALETFLTCDRT